MNAVCPVTRASDVLHASTTHLQAIFLQQTHASAIQIPMFMLAVSVCWVRYETTHCKINIKSNFRCDCSVIPSIVHGACRFRGEGDDRSRAHILSIKVNIQSRPKK